MITKFKRISFFKKMITNKFTKNKLKSPWIRKIVKKKRKILEDFYLKKICNFAAAPSLKKKNYFIY